MPPSRPRDGLRSSDSQRAGPIRPRRTRGRSCDGAESSAASSETDDSTQIGPWTSVPLRDFDHLMSAAGSGWSLHQRNADQGHDAAAGPVRLLRQQSPLQQVHKPASKGPHRSVGRARSVYAEDLTSSAEQGSRGGDCSRESERRSFKTHLAINRDLTNGCDPRKPSMGHEVTEFPQHSYIKISAKPARLLNGAESNKPACANRLSADLDFEPIPTTQSVLQLSEPDKSRCGPWHCPHLHRDVLL